jgi:adenylate cyclase
LRPPVTPNPNHQELFDWLVDGAPGAPTPMEVVAKLGRGLRAGGVPVEKINAFVRTLHPNMAGRRFSWDPSLQIATIGELPWSATTGDEYVTSIVARVVQTGVEVRERLDGPTLGFAALQPFVDQKMTDYVAVPMKFMGGAINVISFVTRAEGGFTDAQLEIIRWIVRPLSRVGETLALMRTAVNLLNTYVGHNAGERILKGKIQVGDTESIRCVIWFSDLRGFTLLSSASTPSETIAMLNELFECQVPAIENNHGEVLKFMGDGMLAIFAINEKHDAASAALAAAGAARDAQVRLEKLNQARSARGAQPISFGVSLHIGEVAYGNIGGSNRLDFTAIGASVNLASRIEGLTGKLGKFLLVSEELATVLALPCRAVGTFELKGVAAPQSVYELVDP